MSMMVGQLPPLDTAPDDEPHEQFTRVLLLGSGHHGELFVLDCPFTRLRAVYLRSLDGVLSRGDVVDSAAVNVAVLRGLLRVGLGSAVDTGEDRGRTVRLRPVATTDAGLGWLVAHRVHGVPVALHTASRQRLAASGRSSGSAA